MATGSPKTRWNGSISDFSLSDNAEDALEVSLTYKGKRAESDILRIGPISTRLLWKGTVEQGEASNRLYYGDNLPILASLLREPAIKGKVRLIYIDPPFATNSIFQSRSQGDAYQESLKTHPVLQTSPFTRLSLLLNN